MSTPDSPASSSPALSPQGGDPAFADDDRGFVVVGVSGSSGSPMALRWALDAAHLRGLRLVAVRAYKSPATSAGTIRPTPSRAADTEDVMREAALDSLAAHVRAALGDAADEVELRVIRGGRRRVLVEASTGAAELVVDAPRGAERTKDPVFARSLVYRARCPVVVMPPHVAQTPAEPWIEGRRTPIG